MAKFCENCGAPQSEDIKFCESCGTQVSVTPVQSPKLDQPRYELPTVPMNPPPPTKKKLFYKRWWLWLIIALVAGTIATISINFSKFSDAIANSKLSGEFYLLDTNSSYDSPTPTFVFKKNGIVNIFKGMGNVSITELGITHNGDYHVIGNHVFVFYDIDEAIQYDLPFSYGILEINSNYDALTSRENGNVYVKKGRSGYNADSGLSQNNNYSLGVTESYSDYGTSQAVTTTQAQTIVNNEPNDSSDFRYIINVNGVAITDYIGIRNDVIIPSTIDGLPVYRISNIAGFSKFPIASIIIPDSVKEIGESAFAECRSLKSVTLGNNVAIIEPYAFGGCSSLTSLTLGDRLASIGRNAFVGCVLLENLDFPDSLSTIETGAFERCSSLKSVAIPGSVESIPQDAFSNCTSLTDLTIGSGVKKIYKAFVGCSSLTSIVIPNSVESIEGAFINCISLNNVKMGTGLIYVNSAFSGCTSLTSIVIPDNVTFLSGTFANCTALSSVTLGSGVTDILISAFKDCSSLTSINITDRVTTIHYDVFSGCKALPNETKQKIWAINPSAIF